MLSLILVLLFVPSFEKTKKQKRGKEWDVDDIFDAAKSPDVSALLLVKLVCGVPIGVLQSMFSGRLVRIDLFTFSSL